MATRAIKRPAGWLTLKQQRRALLKAYPWMSCRIRRGELVCLGIFQPRPLSRRYRVELRYRLGYPPDVRVLFPELRRHPDWQHIPHLNGDGTLCLYFPALNEWGPHRRISHTTVPWTSLWLLYYEFWLATGEVGGWGGHPTCRGDNGFIDVQGLLRQSVRVTALGRYADSPLIGPVAPSACGLPKIKALDVRQRAA